MELNGQLIVQEPKTDKSRRRIDLPKTVVTELTAHRLRMADEGFGQVSWVFCNSTGGPLRRCHFHDNVFKPILKAAKLHDIRFHDLRYTLASLLLTRQVRPDDAEKWKWYLRGLWLSGLRLEESLQLSWEPEAPICVDLEGGRRPRLRIAAEAEKGRQNRLLPITPDFAEFLAAVPMADRFGKVFKVTGLGTGWQMTGRRAGRIISAIGKRAGVVVDKQKEKFASAHDLRRSFGTRWAKNLKPAVLMALMRHENIDTTMAYYVDFDSDDIADELWVGYDFGSKHIEQGNGSNEVSRDVSAPTRAPHAKREESRL